MDKLLESLDETIFTPELKAQINDLFESKISSIEEEYETKLSEALAQEKEKAEAYAEYVKESHKVKVNEYTEYVKSELESTMSAYLDKVVEEYIEQNKITIEESVENAKLRALLDGFDSMLKTGSVYLSDVVEAKGVSKVSKELDSIKEELSKVIKENAELKSERETLIKASIFAEITEGMTVVEKEKFTKLAKYAKFNESDLDSYKSSLVSFKEEVTSTKEEKVEESTKKEVDSQLNESKDTKSYSRFLK